MKTRQRNLAIVICSLLMAVATFFGIASLSNSTVFASGTPTVTMISGASVRKTEETPGIKFTARIDNFVAGGNYKYGMLILPKEAWATCSWDENTNYHAYFLANNITDYADRICSPYLDVETGDWCISYSLVNLQSYTRSLVGVAYVFDGTNYTYTKVDMSENARSISYVAQMALKNETNLSVEQKNVLKSYANAGLSIEEEDVLTDSLFNKEGATEYVPTDYAVRYTLNSGDTISFYTKKSYPAGTTVSFKYYLPSGTTTQWWGWATTGSIEGADYYATGSESNTFKNTVVGNWATATFKTVSAGYIYLGFESGHWVLDGETPYILLDDFVVGTDKENFSENLLDSIFNTNAGIHESFVVSKQEVGFGEEPSEYSAKIIIDKIRSDAGLATFVTKNSYPAGSVITFDYLIPDNVTSSWFAVNCNSTQNQADIYTNYEWRNYLTKGSWQTFTVTLTNSGYVSLVGSVGDWGGKDNPVTEGYILIDNFTVTYNGTTETETFNKGFADSLFNVNTEDAVELGEGYVKPYLGEVAMKYVFNASGETVSQVTKKAYAGGSEISFNYFIPAGTPTSWWGVAYSTSNTGLNIYAAADGAKAYAITKENTVTGEWTYVSFTLPAGGPYYLYFGSEVSVTNWKLNGDNSYMLIDDFAVNGEVETFNYGVEKSIFSVLVSGAVMDSEIGEGYVDAYHGELAMKYNFNVTESPSVTKKAYAGGSTVSFKYFIPEGTTTGGWWGIAWNDVASNANNYHAAGVEANYVGHYALGKVTGAWTDVSFTLPAGGPYYLYFGSDVGSNWKLDGENSYVLIDDFTVGDEVTTFTGCTENPIFNVVAGAITFGEGYVKTYLGDRSAKIIIDKIRSDAGLATFVTKNSYPAGSVITFDYLIPDNVTSSWFAVNCNSTQNQADIYTNYEWRNYLTKGSWQTFTVTLTNSGYVSLVGSVGDWGGKDNPVTEGYILIDNFTVTYNGTTASETFNYGFTDSLFDVNTAGAVVLGDGKEGAAEETPEYDKNSFALVDLVGLGKILDVLENKGGYAYVYGEEIVTTDLPESMLFVSGNIKYTITGNKEFALSFGNGYFIFVDETRVAFYKNTQLLKTIAVSGNNEISFAIAANGSISISIANGGYVGLGVMDTAPTCANLVALGGKGSVDFESFKVTNFKVVGEVLENVPQYVSSEVIDFTAYAFDSANMVSDAGFKLLADAGFTKSLALLQGRVDSLAYDSPSQAEVDRLMAQVNADAIKALDLAQKYGLKHYVFNEPIYNLERQTAWYDWMDEVAAAAATYTNHEAFAGHFLADEPEPEWSWGQWADSEITEMVTAYEEYKTHFKNGDGYINLLPKTSSTFISDNRYKQYIEYYVNNIAKGENGTGFISYDHYPLLTTGITSTHLWNLEYVAGLCRDNSLEFRTYIKVSESGDSSRSIRATESVNDLYMQIYSALCYGVKEIVYYQFTDHEAPDGEAGDGVINGTSLVPTNVYNWAAKANNEVHAFDAAYNNFKWVSASVFGTSITQTNNLESKASAYGYISSVSTTGTALIGNFTDLDGKFTHGAQYAYMVMNYGNTGNNQDVDTITITFNGTPNRALVYENGLARVVTLSSNQLTLSLELGEGAFVIPLK